MLKCRKNSPKTVKVAQKEMADFSQKNKWKNQGKGKYVLPESENDEKPGTKSPKKTISWVCKTIFSVLLGKCNLPPKGVKKHSFVKLWEIRHKCTKNDFW